MMIDTFMMICGLGVCFPLLILVISATRVGMMQRERRYAALSLLGTSKKQINRIILSETLLAAGLAVALGSGLFLVLRQTILPTFQLGQDKFFVSDFVVEPTIFAGVIGLVLLISVLVNWLALRKVKTSPLGVVKDQKKLRKPTVLGLIPLVLAAGGLWQMNQLGVEWFTNNDSLIYFVAVFLLAMIGLLTAGAFLTYLCANLLDRWSQRAGLVMASKRLKMFARPIFSSVSGVVLALFVGSFFVSLVESAKLSLNDYYKNVSNAVELGSLRAQDDKIVFSLSDDSAIDSVVTAIKQHPKLSSNLKQIYIGQYFYEKTPVELGLMTAEELGSRELNLTSGRVYKCADLHSLTQLKCPANLTADAEVILEEDFQNKQTNILPLTTELKARGNLRTNEITLVFTDVLAARVGKLYLQNIVERDFFKNGLEIYITTSEDWFDPIEAYQGLIQAVLIGTIGTIVVAGFSLAVATIGSFFERKKSFYNLRLMGTDLKTLNRVVLIESFVPLIMASILAVISGLLMARYTGSVMSVNFKFALPRADYFIAVGVSILVTFVIVLAILPILKRITSFAQNRTE